MDSTILSSPHHTGRASNHAIALYSSAAGQWLRIHSIPKGPMYSQFIRFGLGEGERVRCIERLAGGTIVIQKHRQQIAIGHLLAKQILVIVLQIDERDT